MRTPQPLSLEDEAALAFAGCGITGPVLVELPYDSGDEHEAGGGNIMINLVDRTIASGDAVRAVALFVINDEGAWMLKQPQDHPRSEIAEPARAGRGHDFVRLYEVCRGCFRKLAKGTTFAQADSRTGCRTRKPASSEVTGPPTLLCDNPPSFLLQSRFAARRFYPVLWALFSPSNRSKPHLRT
jgi:ribosomal protein S14